MYLQLYLGTDHRLRTISNFWNLLVYVIKSSFVIVFRNRLSESSLNYRHPISSRVIDFRHQLFHRYFRTAFNFWSGSLSQIGANFVGSINEYLTFLWLSKPIFDGSLALYANIWRFFDSLSQCSTVVQLSKLALLAGFCSSPPTSLAILSMTQIILPLS